MNRAVRKKERNGMCGLLRSSARPSAATTAVGVNSRVYQTVLVTAFRMSGSVNMVA
ncbi:hypothetical protein GCM10029992_32450 [Glycomyces albus]